MSKRKARLLILALTLMGLRPILAQQPFALDLDFRTEIDTWYVSSILPQDDGKVIISGQFRFNDDGPIPFRSGARIFPDGSRDPTFASPAFMGGKLTQWGDRVYQGNGQIVRRSWPDGTLDTDFILMNSGPYFSSLQGGDYHVYPDGRVLMSGVHMLSDTVRGFVGDHCLIWFSNTGYLDTTQHHRKCLGALFKFQQLPDGKFIGTGSTGTWDGQPASNIIRFHPDGALDTTFQAQVWWGQAFGFLPLADGRVYAAGNFRITGIPDTLRLVRFMPNGTLDPTFNNVIAFQTVELTAPLGAVPSVIHSLDEGRLIVTGAFELVEGQVRKGICLIDTNGVLLDDHFAGPGCGNFQYQGWTYGSIRGILPTGNDQWYIWGGYHGYDDGNTNDPQQRMVSRLHGLGVGVQEVVPPKGRLLVYPNPAADQAWVHVGESLMGTVRVGLYDSPGRLIRERDVVVQGQRIYLDLLGLPAGGYTVELRTAGEVLRLRMVKE